MASRSAWNFELGSTQGRIRPVNFAQTGVWAFVLGVDLADRLVRINTGDYVGVRQTGTLTGVKFIRCSAAFRTDTLPAGASWRVSVRVDGVERAARVLTRSIEIDDLVANVSKLAPGDYELEFRLTLEAQPAAAYTNARVDLELPAFYVDAVMLDSSGSRPVLINRIPGPDEIEVPRNSSIQVDIVDPEAAGVDQTATRVYLDGTLAYDGSAGGFQAGFAGPASAVSNPSADTLRVIVDPETDLESDAEYTVRVQSNTVGGGNAYDSSYTFWSADETKPAVSYATAHSFKKVRVKFAEAVRQVSASASDDALNPANYSFVALDPPRRPAVTPTVASVVQISSSEVELTTSTELSPDRNYRLVVSNVKDLIGSAVAAPTNSAEFVSYSYAGPSGRRFNLFDWWPVKNQIRDASGDLKKLTEVLQEPLEILLYEIDHVQNIWDPDKAPDIWADVLLVELGNPFQFVYELDLTTRRKFLREIVQIYKLKGTAPGIIGAVRRLVGVEVTISEVLADTWRLGHSKLGDDTILGPPAGSPRLYTFYVDTEATLTTTQRTRIERITKYMKPAHTHLDGIREI